MTLTRDDDEEAPDLHLPADGPTPAQLLLAGAQAQSMRACIETLDAGPRQAIALAFFQGLSHGELAAHLREPLGAVTSRVPRGLEKLRRCLDRAGYAR